MKCRHHWPQLIGHIDAGSVHHLLIRTVIDCPKYGKWTCILFLVQSNHAFQQPHLQPNSSLKWSQKRRGPLQLFFAHWHSPKNYSLLNSKLWDESGTNWSTRAIDPKKAHLFALKDQAMSTMQIHPMLDHKTCGRQPMANWRKRNSEFCLQTSPLPNCTWETIQKHWTWWTRLSVSQRNNTRNTKSEAWRLNWDQARSTSTFATFPRRSLRLLCASKMSLAQSLRAIPPAMHQVLGQ